MAQQAHKTKALEEPKGRTLEELLREVARCRVPLTVALEDGESVTIGPMARLKPPPRLEGRIPEGWKDAAH